MPLQEKLRLKARSERFKDHLAGLPTATTGNSKPAASSASDIEAKKKVAPPQVLKSGQAAAALGSAHDVMQGCIFFLRSCSVRQHCICMPKHHSITAFDHSLQLRVMGSTLCQCEKVQWMLQVSLYLYRAERRQGQSALALRHESAVCVSVNESRMMSSTHGTGEGA